MSRNTRNYSKKPVYAAIRLDGAVPVVIADDITIQKAREIAQTYSKNNKAITYIMEGISVEGTHGKYEYADVSYILGHKLAGDDSVLVRDLIAQINHLKLKNLK